MGRIRLERDWATSNPDQRFAAFVVWVTEPVTTATFPLPIVRRVEEFPHASTVIRFNREGDVFLLEVRADFFEHDMPAAAIELGLAAIRRFREEIRDDYLAGGGRHPDPGWARLMSESQKYLNELAKDLPYMGPTVKEAYEMRLGGPFHVTFAEYLDYLRKMGESYASE